MICYKIWINSFYDENLRGLLKQKVISTNTKALSQISTHCDHVAKLYPDAEKCIKMCDM